MDAILVKGGRVIDPASGFDGEADVVVLGGRIAAVGKFGEQDVRGQYRSLDHLQIVDARHLVVCPGLVDLRCHVGEPGKDSEETVAHAAEVAIHGGFTTVAAMPDTDPALDTVASALLVRRQSEQAGFADVHPVCALTRNRAGEELAEVGQLVEAGAVAFSDEQRAVDAPATLLRAMAYVSMFDRAVIEFSQDPALSGGAMNAGYEAMLAGLPGIPSVAEELAVARACMFARETGCHYHAALLTTRNGVRAVKRAQRLGVRVTAEAGALHLAFTDAEVRKAYDTNFKLFPPLRTRDDVEWLKRGLREGVITCISSSHRGVAPQDKELEFGTAPFGAVSLETTLGVVLTHLVRTGDLSLVDAIGRLTIHPARVLRLDSRKGAIQPGHDGDLCLFDPLDEWEVTPAALTSFKKNTPLLGQRLKGRARQVVTRGRVFDLRALAAAAK
ncbi:MAG: dihydroorotase [Planctomycetes bacterium]|nr:dihydroorotase [Planctomycetota bacterium]